MNALDWSIVVALAVVLTSAAIYTQRFSKSVSGFLAAERCAGRYIIMAAGAAASVGVITMMYFFQAYYDTGFTGQWWGYMGAPAGIILAVTGWVIFRFRQTRAMTLAQFFEVRYGRSFRVLSGLVAFTSGILNFGIFPSVGARFFVNFCDLPSHYSFAGIGHPFSTNITIMVILLGISLFFTFMGGQITIMATDFIQNHFAMVVFIFTIIFLLLGFTKEQMAETLLSAASGHSQVNPFDLGKEANFNPLFHITGMLISFYIILGWQGAAGYQCSAKNPHEAKMASVLDQWRILAIVPIISILIPIVTHIYMEHPDFSGNASSIHAQLNEKVDAEIENHIRTDPARAEQYRLLSKLTPEQADQLLALNDVEKDQLNAEDTGTLGIDTHQSPEELAILAQLYLDKSEEVRSQTRIPLVIGRILPNGLMGLFCAAMLAAFISTHTTYLHSWGSMFVQDVVLPFRKTSLSPKAHLNLLRIGIFGVAVFIFFFSIYFVHSQRIMMYTRVTYSIFMGGAGSAIIGGLYWRRGTTAAAWTSMLAGAALSICGLLTTQAGVSAVYAAQQEPFWIKVTGILSTVNFDTAFWKIAEVIFKQNGQMVFFWTCCICMLLYVVVAFFTSKEPFNLDRMLHRAGYEIDGEKVHTTLDAKTIWERLGFTKDFKKSDYTIAIPMLIWPFFWMAVFWIVWPFRHRISDAQWFEFWYIWLIGMFSLGIVISIWFLIGGIRDMIDFVRILRITKANIQDDGTVINHHNADETSSPDSM